MKDKKKTLASLFIASIMIFSIFGFILSSSLSDTVVKYKGYKFINTPQGWLSIIKGERFFFDYTPEDVEHWLNEETKNALKNAEELTITQDPNKFFSSIVSEFSINLYENIPKVSSLKLNFGLTNTSGYNLPLITCENASEKNIVLFFNETDENASISFNNNCIIVQYADQIDLFQQKEAIYFALLGII